eukprot:CAMPEP_0119339636 /NCGR_PEP_ID=MMETSP1333-20130426/98681_1 /TAXON_ID=418940 /ORGANISM="Scyphosphaera apsteinii, Strain RCC1455" /LENGTH=39 /DNA_ID= /DNA_START= /DNA_END= /DNA_ORIENTATION=
MSHPTCTSAQDAAEFGADDVRELDAELATSPNGTRIDIV